jgi:hypothetical protein
VKLMIAGYVPPPNFPGAKAFLENIRRFKTVNELFLFSDHSAYGFQTILPPDDMKRHNERCGISNALFVMAVRFALQRGATHMLYLESDCRVGIDYWDEIMFNEYFAFKFPKVAAGSLVAHSCTNGGYDYYKRFWQFLMEHGKRKQFIPIYGIPVMAGLAMREFGEEAGLVVKPGDARTKYKPAVYPNGALGIYDVSWMAELFGINPDGKFRSDQSLIQHVQASAWDHMIGVRLYDRFGEDALEMVGHLDSCFSSYGDSVSTESQRMTMLQIGRVVAIHQVKSEVQP